MRVDVDRSENGKTIVLVGSTGHCQATCIGLEDGRRSGFKWWWNSFLVNAVLSFQNVSSAMQVHSHLPGDFFSKLEIVAVTFAYVLMNHL